MSDREAAKQQRRKTIVEFLKRDAPPEDHAMVEALTEELFDALDNYDIIASALESLARRG